MRQRHSVWSLIRRFIGNILRDNTMGLAAQTTFYLVLSLCPLLLFLVSILQRLHLTLDERTLSTLFPHSIRKLIVDILSGTPAKVGWWEALIGIWSGSAALWALMRGIFYAMEDDRSKNPTLWVRLFAVAFLLGFALASALSLLLLVFGEKLLLPLLTWLGYEQSWLSGLLPRAGVAAGLFLFVLLLYRLTPGLKRKVGQLWPGALLAAVGWTLVSLLFEIYITKFSGFGALYNGLGAFLGLLMWLYVVSILVLAGAEFNALLLEDPTRK